MPASDLASAITFEAFVAWLGQFLVFESRQSFKLPGVTYGIPKAMLYCQVDFANSSSSHSQIVNSMLPVLHCKLSKATSNVLQIAQNIIKILLAAQCLKFVPWGEGRRWEGASISDLCSYLVDQMNYLPT
jgi:hypothetical protein